MKVWQIFLGINSVCLIIIIFVYITYAIKNKEFLAFPLTPPFWKSFLLGLFVGISTLSITQAIGDWKGGVIFFWEYLFFLCLFLCLFLILKAIFHSQTIVNLDTKKKYQRINFVFTCVMGIVFVFSDAHIFLILYIVYLFI